MVDGEGLVLCSIDGYGVAARAHIGRAVIVERCPAPRLPAILQLFVKDDHIVLQARAVGEHGAGGRGRGGSTRGAGCGWSGCSGGCRGQGQRHVINIKCCRGRLRQLRCQ